ncbi:MarC family protein [Salinispira pacifica]|nr:MarC family protein [Salinispira pacifica]
MILKSGNVTLQLMINEFIPVFLTMFILIDPLGVSMVYLSLVNSAHLNKHEERVVAFKAPGIAFFVLTLFIFFGRQLISALGIQPGSLYVAGGILLFFVAMDLLFGKAKRTTKTNENAGEYDGTEIAIFPLALPLLSGPGAITAILIFTSEHSESLGFTFILLGIVALVLFTAMIAMLGADSCEKFSGEPALR